MARGERKGDRERKDEESRVGGRDRDGESEHVGTGRRESEVAEEAARARSRRRSRTVIEVNRPHNRTNN